MKILLVADLHYALRQWDWVGEVVERFDLVVVAGDLLDIASIVPLEAQIVVVDKYLKRLSAKVPLLVSSGNHDILGVGEKGERDAAWLQGERGSQLYVDGDGVERGEFFFSILPWWDGPETKKQVRAQIIDQQKLAEGKRWVWIYHPPPHGAMVAWNGRKDLGDESLESWIAEYRPAMVLGGHIHNAPFLEGGSWVDLIDGCWVFNSGRQPGGVPTFTVIDTDEGRAIWVAADGAEQVMLEAPLKREPLEA